MSMWSRALSAVCVGVGAISPWPSGPAHPGPAVGIEVRIGEGEVIVHVEGEQATLAHWLQKADPDVTWEDPIAPSELTRVREAIRSLFRDRNEFVVEGAAAEFEVTSVTVPALDSNGYGVPALNFELRYRCDVPPRTVRIHWKTWEHLKWFDQVKLPLMFREFGEVSLGFVTPEEPGYTWHPGAIAPRVVTPPTELVGDLGRIGLPLVSIAVILMYLAALPLLIRRRVGGRLITALGVSALATGLFARDLGRVEIASPFAVDALPPDATAAAEVVDDLLNNLYRAFDARREEDIYSALTVSVVPELVDELYGQIYESLILRNQGGAVCQIEKVTIEARKVDLAATVDPWELLAKPRAAGTRFLGEWTWSVVGTVSHWGHEHQRTNRYDARIWVCLDRGSWRIGSFEVLDLQRTDSDG